MLLLKKWNTLMKISSLKFKNSKITNKKLYFLDLKFQPYPSEPLNLDFCQYDSFKYALQEKMYFYCYFLMTSTPCNKMNNTRDFNIKTHYHPGK